MIAISSVDISIFLFCLFDIWRLQLGSIVFSFELL